MDFFFFFFQYGSKFVSAPDVWEFEYDIRRAINDVNPPFDKPAPPFAGATPLSPMSPSGSIGTGAVIVSAMASALIEAYAALARLWPRPVVRRAAVEDLPSESDGEGSDGDVDDTDDNALDRALIEAYAALARLWPRPVVRRAAVEDLPSENDGEGSDGDVDDTDDNALDRALIEAYATLARLWPRPVVRRAAV